MSTVPHPPSSWARPIRPRAPVARRLSRSCSRDSAAWRSLSIAGIRFFRTAYRNNFSVLKHVVVPLVAFAVFALALYGSVWPVPSFPYNLMPYIILVWLVLGMIVLAALKVRSPELVLRLGRVMGE